MFIGLDDGQLIDKVIRGQAQAFLEPEDVIGGQDQIEIPAAFGKTGHSRMAGEGKGIPLQIFKRVLVVHNPLLGRFYFRVFPQAVILGQCDPQFFFLGLDDLFPDRDGRFS